MPSPSAHVITRRTKLMSRNLTDHLIPIFFATDDAYAPFLGGAIRSMISNADKNYFYRIHILTSTMNEENRKKLAALEGDNSKISFDNPEKKLEHLMGSLSLRDYYSVATYYRLFIADMFPQYDKVLYIDSDTVIPGDISKMYHTDIGANLVGAVPESVMLNAPFNEYAEKVVGVPYNKYFNAGILLMNLKEFRQSRIENRFVSLLSRKKFPVAQDQDYLNVLCQGRVYYFGHEWNLAPVKGLTDKEPCIVHYKMASRPWNYDGVLFGEYFWKYAEASGYYEDICKIKSSRTPADAENDQKVFDGLVALAIDEIARAEEEKERAKKSRIFRTLFAF